MSPALRNLLLATAAIVGGFGVYLVAPGSNADAVRIAALGDGFVVRAAEAEFSVTPAGRGWMADAGLVAPAYVRLQFPVGVGLGKEVDGGNAIIIPEFPSSRLRRVRFEDLDVMPCAARPSVCQLWGTPLPFRVTPHLCAWRPSAVAACTRLDGGSPGVENTMQPGAWVGSGCVVKSCVEIAGEDSRP